MTIIFLKEKSECANLFLYAWLGRDGRNESESTHAMYVAADLKPCGIDLDLCR